MAEIRKLLIRKEKGRVTLPTNFKSFILGFTSHTIIICSLTIPIQNFPKKKKDKPLIIG